MIGFSICDTCKHLREKKKEGWIATCDAFPDGISTSMILNDDMEIRKDCANGIGFEVDEFWAKWE